MHLSNDLWLGASFTLNIVYLCLSLFFFLLAASRGDWFFSLYLSLSRCASRGLDFFRQNVYVSIVNLTFYRTELRLRKCFAECLGCLLPCKIQLPGEAVLVGNPSIFFTKRICVQFHQDGSAG